MRRNARLGLLWRKEYNKVCPQNSSGSTYCNLQVLDKPEIKKIANERDKAENETRECGRNKCKKEHKNINTYKKN